MHQHKNYKGLSIFHKLLLYFILISLVTAIVSGLVNYSRTAKFIMEDTRRHLETKLKNTIDYFDKTYTANIEKDLTFLESSPTLDNLLTVQDEQLYFHRPEAERQFIQFLKSDSKYISFMFINASGSCLINVKGTRRMRDYKSLKQLQADGGLSDKIADLYLRLRSESPRTLLYEGPLQFENQGKTMLVGIAKLEPDIGGFGGAIILQLSLEEYIGYISNLTIFNRSVVWLLDSNNTVIASPDDQEMLLDPRSYLAGDTKADERTFINFKDIKLGSDQKNFMRVVYSLPPDIIASEMKETVFISIGLSLGVMFISVLIALYVSRQFSKPISNLVKTSLSISSGNFDVRAFTGIHGELGLLADTINEMTSNLQKTTVSKDFFNNIIQSMFDPLIVVSADYTISMVNSATCYFLQYREEELIGTPAQNIFDTELITKGTEVDGYVLRGLIDNLETVYTTKKGLEIPVIFSSSVMSGADGSILGYVCIARDITELKEAQQELHHMAYYDQLTKLPNRSNFLTYLERMIKRIKWNRDYMFAVLFIDLDRFKVVNDSLGHIIGDKLLTEVASRLEACTRPTDRISRAAGNDRVARFGGDEFALFLHDVKDISSASRVADRIQMELQKPFHIDGHELYTSASIGIALSATGYENAEDLLRDADAAMYRAKSLGKARSEIFDDDMHVRVKKILQLESDLRTAVEKEEFMVYYQPVVSASDGRITGAEALLRWKHPQQGFISPMDFVPIAEETGLISKLGEWILRMACEQNRAWLDAGYQNIVMKVNFSSRQFKDEKLTDLVRNIIQETGIPARLLDVEITETIAMEKNSIRILNQLTAMGLRTSVDDFGTGYSSLGSLTKFPINTIKIDRAFIKEVGIDVNAEAIIRAIIAMAHSLKMDIVAEGVETEDQLTFLQSEKCDKIQGYLFSPPVREEDFRKLLEKEKRGTPLIRMQSESVV